MKASYGHLPDMDILPKQYRWRIITRQQAALVVVLLVLIAGGFSLYQNRLVQQQELDALRTELGRLALAADALAPQVKQAQTLRQEITALKSEWEGVRKAQETYQGQRVDWAALLQTVYLNPPQDVRLKSVVKKGDLLTVEGSSFAGHAAIARYHEQLVAAPQVVYVDINKVEVVRDPQAGQYIYFNMDIQLRGK